MGTALKERESNNNNDMLFLHYGYMCIERKEAEDEHLLHPTVPTCGLELAYYYC